MADLIDYYDKLTAEQAKLAMYARRFRKFRWPVPGIAKNLIKGIEDEYLEVKSELQRTREVIWADPMLRETMKMREEEATVAARERLVSRKTLTALPGKPYAASMGVMAAANKTVLLEREEFIRQFYRDEAEFYYGSGAWQQDGIPISKLDPLLEQVRCDHDSARFEHHRALDGLHTRVRLETSAQHEPVSMIVDNVLRNVRSKHPAVERPTETPLSKLLQAERPEPEKAPRQKSLSGPSR